MSICSCGITICLMERVLVKGVYLRGVCLMIVRVYMCVHGYFGVNLDQSLNAKGVDER